MSRIGRRVAFALGWFVVGCIAADVAGNVLFGSANVLVFVIALGFGLGAYGVLLIRDRSRPTGEHRQPMSRDIAEP